MLQVVLRMTSIMVCTECVRKHRVRVYLYFLAARCWSSLHQPQHIESHVVLTSPSQTEAKTSWASLQIHTVIPWVLLEERNRVRTKRERWKENVNDLVVKSELDDPTEIPYFVFIFNIFQILYY